MWNNLVVYLRLVRFSHTIFALPFAVIGAMLAAEGLPTISVSLWILVAMVAARSAAMGFNRLVDADIDAENPRTQGREIPAGLISKAQVTLFTILMSGLFFLAAGMLNRVALILSPVVLGILLGYSFTKRFTSLSHFVLGISLGIAPLGAWIAVLGDDSFTGILEPVSLGVAVLFWVAGFDIIYSCMDIDFDRKRLLHSIPSRLGVERALRLARTLHVLMMATLIALAVTSGAGIVFSIGIAAVGLLLVHEHRLVSADDLSKVNQAFFTVNSIVGIVLMLCVIADFLIFHRVP